MVSEWSTTRTVEPDIKAHMKWDGLSPVGAELFFVHLDGALAREKSLEWVNVHEFDPDRVYRQMIDIGASEEEAALYAGSAVEGFEHHQKNIYFQALARLSLEKNPGLLRQIEKLYAPTTSRPVPRGSHLYLHLKTLADKTTITAQMKLEETVAAFVVDFSLPASEIAQSLRLHVDDLCSLEHYTAMSPQYICRQVLSKVRAGGGDYVTAVTQIEMLEYIVPGLLGDVEKLIDHLEKSILLTTRTASRARVNAIEIGYDDMSGLAEVFEQCCELSEDGNVLALSGKPRMGGSSGLGGSSASAGSKAFAWVNNCRNCSSPLCTAKDKISDCLVCGPNKPKLTLDMPRPLRGLTYAQRDWFREKKPRTMKDVKVDPEWVRERTRAFVESRRATSAAPSAGVHVLHDIGEEAWQSMSHDEQRAALIEVDAAYYDIPPDDAIIGTIYDDDAPVLAIEGLDTMESIKRNVAATTGVEAGRIRFAVEPPGVGDGRSEDDRSHDTYARRPVHADGWDAKGHTRSDEGHSVDATRLDMSKISNADRTLIAAGLKAKGQTLAAGRMAPAGGSLRKDTLRYMGVPASDRLDPRAALSLDFSLADRRSAIKTELDPGKADRTERALQAFGGADQMLAIQGGSKNAAITALNCMRGRAASSAPSALGGGVAKLEGKDAVLPPPGDSHPSKSRMAMDGRRYREMAMREGIKKDDKEGEPGLAKKPEPATAKLGISGTASYALYNELQLHLTSLPPEDLSGRMKIVRSDFLYGKMVIKASEVGAERSMIKHVLWQGAEMIQALMKHEATHNWARMSRMLTLQTASTAAIRLMDNGEFDDMDLVSSEDGESEDQVMWTPSAGLPHVSSTMLPALENIESGIVSIASGRYTPRDKIGALADVMVMLAVAQAKVQVQSLASNHRGTRGVEREKRSTSDEADSEEWPAIPADGSKDSSTVSTPLPPGKQVTPSKPSGEAAETVEQVAVIPELGETAGDGPEGKAEQDAPGDRGDGPWARAVRRHKKAPAPREGAVTRHSSSKTPPPVSGIVANMGSAELERFRCSQD